LAEYAQTRDRLLPAPTASSFFISTVGTRLGYAYFGKTFRKLVERSGIAAGSAVRPRIHDLRHTFCVRTLIGWYRDEVDVQARLPWLATYVGHREPRYTYWYLTAVSELLAEATARLEALEAQR
jgi:integrase